MRATNAMILPVSLLLLPFVSANLGFWDCLIGPKPVDLGFWDHVSCCYWQNCIPDDYDYDEELGLPLPDLPEYRVRTGSAPGSSITCWPSKGGIYRLDNVFAIQRQFLGLDRHIPRILKPEVSIEEEDAFCNQLRKLGARWWEVWWMADWVEYDEPAEVRPVIYTGWPASGGVCVLNTTALVAAENGYGIIYNSLTMEEQCETIKVFGGIFYQDPKDCPYLDLAEE